MSTRVEVNPELLAWACRRSGLAFDAVQHRFPMLAAWESGEQQPTLKQLESFAQAMHTPIGFLFLPEPPVETVPIPDYRTIGDAGVRLPSANLLDTIYQCQQRQDWYRDFAILNHEPAVEHFGSLSATANTAAAANVMRAALEFDIENRGSSRTEALRILIEHAEALGFLVMVNGVVGSNTHRKLDPQEFRGFALADAVAPVVFVNGADTKAAQIFTLVHELTHLWIGGTALDDMDFATREWQDSERWCNQVAAEVLMPLEALPGALDHGEVLADATERLSRRFKVSTLVVLRRLYDAGSLSWEEYRSAYDAESRRLTGLLRERAGSGGNFYNTQPTRFGRRFTRAVITSTLEGHTLYRDALRLLSFKKVSTLNNLASHLGIG
jgi:Zn-dependent peptidase ImmA (M78 family)